MIFKKFNWKPIELNFVNPIKTSGAILKQRKIYLVEITDINNNKFYGECAPLPHFGSESFYELEIALNNCRKLIIDKKLTEITSSFDEYLNQFNTTPTLRAAVEQSILSSLKFYDEQSLWKIIPRTESCSIKVNALVDIRSPFNTAETSLIFKEAGFGTIKFKIGRDNFSDDLEALNKTRKVIGKEANFRIDVNGKWSLNEAEEKLKYLEIINLEYAEQPTADTDDLIKLARNSKIPIAADESIRMITDAEKIINSDISCLVIKPALIGGILNTLKIIKMAESAGKSIVISSSFESALSRYNMLYLASVLSKKRAHGITLSNVFEDDLFNDQLNIINGTLAFRNSLFLKNIDLSHIF
ncbi:MAG: o-succinylbenzoate synthase [Ignavibacteriae bacterium]|nr:o-succinylbenzoate synthase [Ignavibacteriota bacterium]NOG99968.1 o-succinylbenzoate synthase [Ignavibacteriota bacterium]